ncbi:hypothetical protein [Acinetobacter rudis]|uniref:Uncharacterized protein n=1 Tax=Acinetobacter rudis TaxID=632955 RepID=A0AAW8J8W3_9GAMM|nr:hypothetical protein [Acinetobacter rudis]MDQ8936214.1 hypothetical protein [Acinetobacter rudis]MDQ8954156.1 hypothetical protein [Acinetobacter rudis]MDQ9018428.1 hypothetical protein [Acinetobacter rudis]
MKKVLKALVFTAITLPVVAFAEQQTTTVEKVIAATGGAAAQTEVKRENTTVISPRTGIRYTLGDTSGRPVVLKTAAIAAATPATASRIVASNPALSASSQEKAKQTLINVAGATIAE